MKGFTFQGAILRPEATVAPNEPWFSGLPQTDGFFWFRKPTAPEFASLLYYFPADRFAEAIGHGMIKESQLLEYEFAGPIRPPGTVYCATCFPCQ